MENKKSNLPKGGWVIGHIDLSALNQTCRPQKKDSYRDPTDNRC